MVEDQRMSYQDMEPTLPSLPRIMGDQSLSRPNLQNQDPYYYDDGEGAHPAEQYYSNGGEYAEDAARYDLEQRYASDEELGYQPHPGQYPPSRTTSNQSHYAQHHQHQPTSRGNPYTNQQYRVRNDEDEFTMMDKKGSSRSARSAGGNPRSGSGRY